MYIVVVYDASPGERADIRPLLLTKLHWIQNSVFAGELTRTAAEDLFEALKGVAQAARVTFWMFDRPPEVRFAGTQGDQESVFL